MKLDLEYTSGTETFKVVASGIFFIPIIHFSNNHDFVKHKIRCGKTLGGLKIVEYYPPDYLNKKPKKEKNKK